MKLPNWAYYVVIGLVIVLYYIADSTGLLLLAMPFIVGGACWVLWHLYPETPEQ
jgi:hypothetical protein